MVASKIWDYACLQSDKNLHSFDILCTGIKRQRGYRTFVC
jgi:hypothetical protein